MAPVAVFGNGECGFAVMTGAAGFTCFHLGHGYCLLARTRGVNTRVAILALECCHMQFVAEKDISRAGNPEASVFHRVTLDAVTQGEALFPIMAGSAGSALFHLYHAHLFIGSGFIDPVMTRFTLQGLEVPGMAEGGRSGLFDPIGYGAHGMT